MEFARSITIVHQQEYEIHNPQSCTQSTRLSILVLAYILMAIYYMNPHWYGYNIVHKKDWWTGELYMYMMSCNTDSAAAGTSEKWASEP